MIPVCSVRNQYTVGCGLCKFKQLHGSMSKCPLLFALIVYFVYSIDLPIYGALKRLCQWHNAMVRIFDCSENTGGVSSVLTLWSQSLQAHLIPAGVRNGLSLWHGSIAIAGSQVSYTCWNGFICCHHFVSAWC